MPFLKRIVKSVLGTAIFISLQQDGECRRSYSGYQNEPTGYREFGRSRVNNYWTRSPSSSGRDSWRDPFPDYFGRSENIFDSRAPFENASPYRKSQEKELPKSESTGKKQRTIFVKGKRNLVRGKKLQVEGNQNKVRGR